MFLKKSPLKKNVFKSTSSKKGKTTIKKNNNYTKLVTSFEAKLKTN